MEDSSATTSATVGAGQSGAALTLSAVFGRGQATLAALQEGSLPSAAPAFQERVRDALRDLLQCSVAVSRGDIFSANETLDDFSADRLRFVLVPFYLAELTQLLADDRRGAHLLRARDYYGEFLENAHRLKLLAEPDVRTWKRKGPPQGNARREEKIERARREKQVRQELAALRAQLQRNAAAGADADAGIDEDAFRQCVALEIRLAGKTAVEGLDLIEQELPLVERRAQLERLEAAKGGRWQESASAPASAPARPVTIDLPPGYTQTAAPGGGVTITRASLARDVFRPGYNMATMTIEEAGERDYAEMVARQGREQASAAARAAEPDEDDTRHYDSVTVYKERDWDAFLDANPAGSGNTMGNLG